MPDGSISWTRTKPEANVMIPVSNNELSKDFCKDTGPEIVLKIYLIVEFIVRAPEYEYGALNTLPFGAM
jgi:hypothetical protein